VELLKERGMRGTTVQEICRRARVTTGAIQHHFGSKTGLIAEVIKSLFRPFAESIGSNQVPHATTLEERVAHVVDHFWSIYGNDRYLALTEVALSARNDPELMQLVMDYRGRQLATLEQLMSEVFTDVDLDIDELVATVHSMSDFLRGYALRRQIYTAHGSEKASDHSALRHAHRVLFETFRRHQSIAAMAD